MAHINQGQGIGEAADFLTRFHNISNKLKKRFLRKPNVAEACDQFNVLAIECEQKELWQYAGLCWLAAARCQGTLENASLEINLLVKAGRQFLIAEKKNNDIGCSSIGQEDIQAAVSCFGHSMARCSNQPGFNTISAGLSVELALALGPGPAGIQQLRKAIDIFPTSKAINTLVSFHIKQVGKMMGDWRTIFVTGGAGYIGSHCIVELLECGYDVVAIDNFANSVTETDGESAALKRVEQITGKKVTFYNCDLLDREKLETVFNQHKIDCVIHFAAIKAVGESMQVPLHYYRNNIIGAINLLEVMKATGCFQLVFSSSCTVYGEPTELPITEEHETGNITNVYGRTKYFIEEMLKDISRAEKSWNIISLRYFNPVGAHRSGLIGEDPTKPFTNLMPFIAQVALRHKPELIIFGGDYPTDDGTGVRDYIHVMDLAAGHVAALNALHKQHLRLKIYNLGTGNGVTVLELIKTFEKVTGTTVPYVVKERREGDIVSMYANTDLAKKELNWTAKYNVEQMCEDFWRWQTMNPHGYRPSLKNGIIEHLNNTS